MQAIAKLSSASDALPFRERYREEINCQIVHDSIHRRPGWTVTYLLEVGGTPAGFGSVAIGVPWKDKPTLFPRELVLIARIAEFDESRRSFPAQHLDVIGI